MKMKITRKQIIRIVKEEISRITEGEVVDMFGSDQKKAQAEERIARALAARAEEMLDVDDDFPHTVHRH